MELGFIIPSYTQKTFNNVQKCVSSIKKVYGDVKTVVVDNYIGGPNRSFNDNTLYYKNSSNSFELGAFWFAVDKHPEIDRWIIIHDSCNLNSKIPIDIYQEKKDLFIPFWCDIPEHYAPVIPILINNIESIGLKYEELKNDNWKSVCGIMSIIDKSLVDKMIDIGLNKINPKTKEDAVCAEILFGLAVTYIKGEEINPLHDFPISTFLHNKEAWGFITKYTGGLKSVNHLNLQFNENTSFHPNKENNYIYKEKEYINLNNVYSSEEELYMHLLKMIISNKKALTDLMDTSPNYINLKNINPILSKYKIQNLYHRVRHEAFNFKHFPEYFNKKYKSL